MLIQIDREIVIRDSVKSFGATEVQQVSVDNQWAATHSSEIQTLATLPKMKKLHCCRSLLHHNVLDNCSVTSCGNCDADGNAIGKRG